MRRKKIVRKPRGAFSNRVRGASLGKKKLRRRRESEGG